MGTIAYNKIINRPLNVQDLIITKEGFLYKSTDRPETKSERRFSVCSYCYNIGLFRIKLCMILCLSIILPFAYCCMLLLQYFKLIEGDAEDDAKLIKHAYFSTMETICMWTQIGHRIAVR